MWNHAFHGYSCKITHPAWIFMHNHKFGMNVNVKSALRLTQQSVKWLESSPIRSIVNVSSIAGLRAYPGSLPYKISKAAMDQMTRCTAIELASKGIRVNSVNPGVIDTEFFVKSGMSAKAANNYVKEKIKVHQKVILLLLFLIFLKSIVC